MEAQSVGAGGGVAEGGGCEDHISIIVGGMSAARQDLGSTTPAGDNRRAMKMDIDDSAYMQLQQQQQRQQQQQQNNRNK